MDVTARSALVISSPAENGVRNTQTNTTMDKTNGKLDPKQREHLSRILNDAKTREQSRLENADGVSTDSILRALAEKAGALDLVQKIVELEKQIETAKEKLTPLGFDLDYSGDLQLDSDAPRSLSEKYEKQVGEAKSSIEKSLKKYDLAIIGVWTAETAAEAKKIVEGLI
ncbi:MAG: hypothetical protein WCE61_14815 [Candidatus Acidiferrum sp.]